MIRKAISIQERLVVESAGLPSYRQSLVSCLYYLGLLLKHQGQYVQAQETQRQALIIQELLATGFKDVPRYQQVLADIHSELAHILMLRGELMEAEMQCQKALPLLEGLLEKHPDGLQYKVDI